MSPAGNRAAPRLVVVGGDAAGMSAASQARRLAPDLEIVVLEQGPDISYAACGVPLLVEGRLTEPRALLALTPEAARERRGLDVRTEHRVQELDLARQQVRGVVRDSGEPFALDYDRLVLATGARPVRPALPGVDLRGVFAVRRLEHAVALTEYLQGAEARRTVVVGAGLVGLDLAEGLRGRGLAVTLVKGSATPLLELEPELGALAEEALIRNGCVLLREAPLYGIAAGEAGGLVVRAGGEQLPADLVVLAVGVRPAAELARAAGLRLEAHGGVAVNERAETSDRRVYAAGDCASHQHRVTKRPVEVAQALAANRQGRVAGANAALALLSAGGAAGPLAGQRSPEHPGTLGTVVKKVFDVEVGRTGLDLAAAREAGFDAVVTVVTGRTRAGYYPGSGPIKVALVAERRTGRLLGGQVAGHEGSAKRIDVLVTALHAGLDLAGLVQLDLGYAPAFSTVRDPLLIAARAALQRI